MVQVSGPAARCRRPVPDGHAVAPRAGPGPARTGTAIARHVAREVPARHRANSIPRRRRRALRRVQRNGSRARARTGRARAAASTEDAVPYKPRIDFAAAQCAHASRGQFERQRNAVQPAADLGHRRPHSASVSRNAGCAAIARSTNRRTASCCRQRRERQLALPDRARRTAAAGRSSRPRCATARGSTRAPYRVRRLAAACFASSAQACTTCSQLSRISSSCRSSRYASAARPRRPPRILLDAEHRRHGLRHEPLIDQRLRT